MAWKVISRKACWLKLLLKREQLWKWQCLFHGDIYKAKGHWEERHIMFLVGFNARRARVREGAESKKTQTIRVISLQPTVSTCRAQCCLNGGFTKENWVTKFRKSRTIVVNTWLGREEHDLLDMFLVQELKWSCLFSFLFSLPGFMFQE